jgi:hypothetical protein
MKKTLLKFSSLIYLTAFRKFSKANYWEINLNELTVLCDCSEKEIMYACKDFRAIILQSMEEIGTITNFGEVGIPPVSYRLSS